MNKRLDGAVPAEVAVVGVLVRRVVSSGVAVVIWSGELGGASLIRQGIPSLHMSLAGITEDSAKGITCDSGTLHEMEVEDGRTRVLSHLTVHR